MHIKALQITKILGSPKCCTMYRKRDFVALNYYVDIISKKPRFSNNNAFFNFLPLFPASKAMI